jgi:DNA polymerase-3 subunit gamma/tau
VLAKALNCERGPAADPCNECTPCVEITRGSDLDVIEVDAATYSKVEQVRELTESLKYGPARDRYKVVVLDEIHRLSRQAFDALLKIVEEPPPHLVFIFATTEIDAVPATILSRCQEFHFRRVPSLTLAAHLRSICEAEGIRTSDTALRLIARAGEGSVRDSVALLDQLATFGSSAIADEDAVRLLGGLDTALFQKLLESILAGDPAGVGAAVRRVEDEGWDPRHVYGQFLAFCRDALHLAMGGSPEQVDLPGEEAQTLAAMARSGGYENLLRLMNQLLASEMIVRRSETGALAVEIAWLRAAELPKLTRIEDLLAGNFQPGAPAPPPQAARPAAAPRPAPAPAPPPRREPAPAAPPPRAATPPPPAEAQRPAAPPAPAAAPRRSSDPVTAFREEVSKRRHHAGSYLDEAESLRMEDGILEIIYPTGDNFLSSRLQANLPLYKDAASAVWESDVQVRLVAGKARPVETAPAQNATPAEAADNPAVQTVLQIFGGRVEQIQEHGSFTED